MIVRELFLQLIREALSRDFLVAIVTFSSQTTLIAETLKRRLSCEHAERIIIRGNDGTWEHRGVSAVSHLHFQDDFIPIRVHAHTGYSPQFGKQLHLASVARHARERHNIVLRRCDVVLIDDDARNIQIAESHEIDAIWCDPDNPQQ